MIRPLIGVKATAVAIGIVATAGVAAAATVTQAPAANVAVAPQVEADLPELPTAPKGLPDLPLPDLTEIAGVLGSLPLPTVPGGGSVPNVPSLPGLPGAGGLPVDPADLSGPAAAAVTQVTALLPTPEALQAVVMGCVSDFTALVPVPTPDVGNPFGAILGVLGMFGGSGGSLPAAPDPVAVQAAVTECVTAVLGLIPDPGALASALTASFGGTVPGPVAAVLDVLLGEAGSLPDAQHLLDLVTALTSATGSPADALHELTDALEAALPPQLAGLLTLPLAIVDQVFATIGLS